MTNDPNFPPSLPAAATALYPPAGGMLTDESRRRLARTARWAIVVGVLSLLGALLAVVQLVSALSPRGAGAGTGSIGVLLQVAIGVIALNFGSRLKQAIAPGGEPLLASALSMQRVLFKTVGIISIVILGIMILALGGGMLFALRSFS